MLEYPTVLICTQMIAQLRHFEVEGTGRGNILAFPRGTFGTLLNPRLGLVFGASIIAIR